MKAVDKSKSSNRIVIYLSTVMIKEREVLTGITAADETELPVL